SYGPTPTCSTQNRPVRPRFAAPPSRRPRGKRACPFADRTSPVRRAPVGHDVRAAPGARRGSAAALGLARLPRATPQHSADVAEPPTWRRSFLAELAARWRYLSGGDGLCRALAVRVDGGRCGLWCSSWK